MEEMSRIVFAYACDKKEAEFVDVFKRKIAERNQVKTKKVLYRLPAQFTPNHKAQAIRPVLFAEHKLQ